jgi:DNA-binding LytR/AlgR family response regulator
VTGGFVDGQDQAARPGAGPGAGRAAADQGRPGLSFSPRHAGFWIAWIAFAGFTSLMNSLSTTHDLERHHVPFRRWEPFAWEITSLIATLALLPALVWFVERRPWSDRPRWRTAALYAAGAIGFSAAHVAAMVALRQLIYAIAWGAYHFGPLRSELPYELRKDAVSFFLMIIILNLLREVERRLVAPLLVAAPAAPEQERITIRDGARDVALDSEAIVAVRAAGNYVEVFRIGEKPLMLRATLAELEARLAGSGLARVHRSWLIALRHVQAISASGSGDFRARLRDGREAPVSRRYKDAIQGLRS